MKTFGLIGRKLSHSFSKRFFENKFADENIEGNEYKLFEIDDINLFNQLLKDNPSISGLNVTIPYKNEVIPFLDALDESAEKVGAVNVIKVKTEASGEEKLIGYNTDYLAFKNSLVNWLKGKVVQALVLGTGGASQAICTALSELSIPFLSVSRSSEKGLTYEEISRKPELVEHHRLIINTTPLGMYPNVDQHPIIDYALLSKDYFLYDLVYNPEVTLFMKKGEARGAKIKNGLEMLHLQAEYSWEIWNK